MISLPEYRSLQTSVYLNTGLLKKPGGCPVVFAGVVYKKNGIMGY
jgi:hypothetical protein